MSTYATEDWTGTAYEQHRSYVMAVLVRRCGWLEPDEREEIYQDAFLVVLEKVRAGRLDLGEMAAAQVRAFLTQTAINKALDEGKRVGRSRSVPLEDTELNVSDGSNAPEEVAAAGFEGARLREIVGDLSERKAAIVKLRFFFDRSPTEIQGFLGISERVYRRELERAMRQIHDGFELVRDGSYCASRRSGIIALMTGIAGPTRARAAREHLKSCPSCTAWASQLREAARDVGALAPMPDLVLRRGPFERLLDALHGLRDSLFDAGATAKQHGAALLARVDQASAGVISGARPGSVAAVLASCVTLGGSAGYCVVNGLPEPLRGAAAVVLGDSSKDVHKHAAAETHHASSAPPPLEESAPVEASSPEPPPEEPSPPPSKPKPQKRSHQHKSASSGEAAAAAASEPATPEAVNQEFGFEGESAPAPAPAPAPPPEPSPAPAGGGDEFGP